MAASSYDEALRRVLAHEGGYSNDVRDPGGPTNFGITLADYRAYVKANGTADDVRVMTVAQAQKIYRAKYWDAQRCDELPAGLDYAVFDYGVNSGIGRSGKVLRRLLELSARSSAVTDPATAATAAANAEAAWANALAQIGQSQVEQVGQTARAELVSGDPLQRAWRPLYALELALIECPAFVLTLLHALWVGQESSINGFSVLSGLLMAYFGARFGVLGVYVSGRTREKQALAGGDTVPSIVEQVLKAVAKKK